MQRKNLLKGKIIDTQIALEIHTEAEAEANAKATATATAKKKNYGADEVGLEIEKLLSPILRQHDLTNENEYARLEKLAGDWYPDNLEPKEMQKCALLQQILINILPISREEQNKQKRDEVLLLKEIEENERNERNALFNKNANELKINDPISVIRKYEEASNKYRDDLAADIEAEVNKISDLHIISNLYQIVKKTTPNLRTDKDISSAKNQIFSGLLNQYEEENSDTRKEKEIDKALDHNPELLYALKKVKVIREATNTLLTGNYNDENKVCRNNIVKFKNKIVENKEILTKSRDSGFDTFVKALGVAGAAIFGLGVGGYFAYHRLFGSKATRGHDYVSKMIGATNKHPKKRPG